jgi:hypothetical protein
MYRNLGFKKYFKEISFQFWKFFSKELIEFVKKNSKFLQQVNILHKKERKKEIKGYTYVCMERLGNVPRPRHKVKQD